MQTLFNRFRPISSFTSGGLYVPRSSVFRPSVSRTVDVPREGSFGTPLDGLIPDYRTDGTSVLQEGQCDGKLAMTIPSS
ncbi:hypothetical protein SprV_0501889300 [Sparganum proliferum]